MPRRIFHITTPEAWERQRPSGEYRHETLETEGFIHCSNEDQVESTWQRIFGREEGLIVLEIDVDRLTSELRDEDGEPGETFPHVYGPVNTGAVTRVHPLRSLVRHHG